MNELSQTLKHSCACCAEDAATYMRVLSNPSRILILFELMGGRLSVGELETALGVGQAYVSQQLARLRSDGVVKADREGRIVYYSILDPKVKPLMEAFQRTFC